MKLTHRQLQDMIIKEVETRKQRTKRAPKTWTYDELPKVPDPVTGAPTWEIALTVNYTDPWTIGPGNADPKYRYGDIITGHPTLNNEAKITRRQLRRIIKEEIDASITGGKKKRKKGEPKDQYLYGTDVANSEDEVARHDAWAGGDNLNEPSDWQKVFDMISEADSDGDGTSDAEELELIANNLPDDGTTDITQEPLDIVDGDTGEIYLLAVDDDAWNTTPFNGLAADFAVWLAGQDGEFIKHPDAEELTQEHGYDAWWVRDPRNSDLPLASQPPKDLVGKYNLPSDGWGIPEPDRGTTSEGTSFDEMPASWQQILKNVL